MTPLKNKSHKRKQKIIFARRFIAFSILIIILVPIIICNQLAVEKEESTQIAMKANAVAVAESLGYQTGQKDEETKTDAAVQTEEVETQTQEQMQAQTQEQTIEELPKVPETIEEKSHEDSKKYIQQDDGVKRAYLTFDDGPSDNTDTILDILSQYGLKATFFVIEKTDQASIQHYQRILNEGHTLAMHSASHVYSQIYASMDAYVNDVTELQNYLESITGFKPEFYRFPGGSSNTVGDISMNDCVTYLDSVDITYFDWNVDSGDANRCGSSADEIVSNVVNGVCKHNNSVVLMHDTNAKATTVAALPYIIQQLEDMGVTILPITDETVPVHHRINR